MGASDLRKHPFPPAGPGGLFRAAFGRLRTALHCNRLELGRQELSCIDRLEHAYTPEVPDQIRFCPTN